MKPMPQSLKLHIWAIVKDYKMNYSTKNFGECLMPHKNCKIVTPNDFIIIVIFADLNVELSAKYNNIQTFIANTTITYIWFSLNDNY